MLWEEMEKYTKLTGEDATHVPIMKLGAYLDGYEKGTEVLDKIRAEIEQDAFKDVNGSKYIFVNRVNQILDKYKAESEPQESDIDKRKPCINYSDGCEEWAGCPCVYYKAESEGT